MPLNDDVDDYRNGWPPDKFEAAPCVEPGGMVEPAEIAEMFPDARVGGGWYPGAWRVEQGGNGGAITARPAENVLHIAASNWTIDPADPANPNRGIAGWNSSARACNGYNDQYGNMQQYASVWSAVNGTKDGNWRNRTWEAWNPEGLNGTAEQYNASTYTAEQCERFSDLLAWDHIENDAILDDMSDSRRASHGCGAHRYGIDPWRVSGGEVWTAHAGKTCPGTARVRQLPGIVARARVIASAVSTGRCTYLPAGRVNLAVAIARTGGVPAPTPSPQPIPEFELTEVGMFIMYGPGGAALCGPGYVQHLDEEGYQHALKIPGIKQIDVDRRGWDVTRAILLQGYVADKITDGLAAIPKA